MNRQAFSQHCHKIIQIGGCILTVNNHLWSSLQPHGLFIFAQGERYMDILLCQKNSLQGNNLSKKKKAGIYFVNFHVYPVWLFHSNLCYS